MSGSSNPKRKSTADLIADQAEAYEAHVLRQSGGELLVAAALRRSDGRVVPYALSIDARSTVPKVREQTPDRLPGFCPDRHINADGTFCMGWQAADPLNVVDPTAAGEWWARLLKFLRLQELATKLRRWPGGHEWAHGDAAIPQRRAEICAKALGPAFEQALTARRLKVAKRRGRAGFKALMHGERRLYSVLIIPERVATLRQACFCGSGRTLLSCSDHADRAAELVSAIEAWERAEKEFWQLASARTCCGSLAACPLSQSPTPANADAPSITLKAA